MVATRKKIRKGDLRPNLYLGKEYLTFHSDLSRFKKSTSLQLFLPKITIKCGQFFLKTEGATADLNPKKIQQSPEKSQKSEKVF